MTERKESSRERLQRAALELFREQGYGSTTVADIADRAGVTSRTFFRLFQDKRGVLFSDDDRLITILLGALPPGDDAGPALHQALRTLAHEMQPRHDLLSDRAAVISSTPELRERDLLKNRAWVETLGEVLRDRGVDPLTASAQVEVAFGLFHAAFSSWVRAGNDAHLADLLDTAYRAVGLHLDEPAQVRPRRRPAPGAGSGERPGPARRPAR